jgi:hypothetical protein
VLSAKITNFSTVVPVVQVLGVPAEVMRSIPSVLLLVVRPLLRVEASVAGVMQPPSLRLKRTIFRSKTFLFSTDLKN